ncbi:MAG TPA: hypothetical protein VJ385_16140 [Fibrobacteria bacterium]|nr:hypothetical protein [Fibrobacteria bacterium]
MEHLTGVSNFDTDSILAHYRHAASIAALALFFLEGALLVLLLSVRGKADAARAPRMNRTGS